MKTSTDATQEIERKYDATSDAESLPPLNDVEGVIQVEERTEILDATYYDTPDLQLSTHGITLRRRTGGSDAGWHLKLPSGPDAREEIRAPLTDETAVPGTLASLVRARTRDQSLLPVVRIVNVRDVRRLLDAEGRALAEVSYDNVTAHPIDPSTPEVAASMEWSEAEVELIEGSPPFLDTVEHHLTAAGMQRSRSASKLARALGNRLPARPSAQPTRPTHTPHGTKKRKTKRPSAADVVLGYLSEHTARITDLDIAVRRDQPDAVHQMRVSARRLRSALKTFRTVLDRKVTEPLADELKWLGAKLGVDRDREVLTARLYERIDELPESLIVGPVPTRVGSWSDAQRTENRSGLMNVLNGPRYLALLRALDALLAQPPLLPGSDKPATATLPKDVLRDWQRLANRIQPTRTTPPGPERDLQLHNARKAAKRTRYAAEAVQPALGKPAKKFRIQMKALQKLLGEHQDSVVARNTLRDLATQATLAGESSFTYGLLHHVEHDRADDAERQLPAAWHTASRPKLRKCLAR
ncbi:CHAD domain-containing protein [Streptomyces sp. NPDC057486]|uniref:CYTH and CHAD domain-containing protein n=1 Tax=Streptomyces sp. NPDC057486 TaxID=3346145 RepID=UPI0036A72A68